MSKLLATLLLFASLALPAAAQLPTPPDGATFTDPDRAARIHFRDLDTERGAAKLQRHLEAKPNDPRAWTASAFRHSLERNAEAAIEHLERARALVGDSDRKRRELLWSEGWIQLNLGNYPAASTAWIEAVKTHGGQPRWVPHSYALLAERAGERGTALAWFALAARNHPQTWGTRHGVLQYTRPWHQHERDAALRLYEAHAEARNAER